MTQRKREPKREQSKTREYRAWSEMRRRCANPNHPAYSQYGGRGIVVAARWSKFLAFLEDVGPQPPGTQLGRKDPNGPYAPGNALWMTPPESANLRRPRRWWRKPEIQAA